MRFYRNIREKSPEEFDLLKTEMDKMKHTQEPASDGVTEISWRDFGMYFNIKFFYEEKPFFFEQ